MIQKAILIYRNNNIDYFYLIIYINYLKNNSINNNKMNPYSVSNKKRKRADSLPKTNTDNQPSDNQNIKRRKIELSQEQKEKIAHFMTHETDMIKTIMHFSVHDHHSLQWSLNLGQTGKNQYEIFKAYIQEDIAKHHNTDPHTSPFIPFLNNFGEPFYYDETNNSIIASETNFTRYLHLTQSNPINQYQFAQKYVNNFDLALISFISHFIRNPFVRTYDKKNNLFTIIINSYSNNITYLLTLNPENIIEKFILNKILEYLIFSEFNYHITTDFTVNIKFYKKLKQLFPQLISNLNEVPKINFNNAKFNSTIQENIFTFEITEQNGIQWIINHNNPQSLNAISELFHSIISINLFDLYSTKYNPSFQDFLNNLLYIVCKNTNSENINYSSLINLLTICYYKIIEDQSNPNFYFLKIMLCSQNNCVINLTLKYINLILNSHINPSQTSFLLDAILTQNLNWLKNNFEKFHPIFSNLINNYLSPIINNKDMLKYENKNIINKKILIIANEFINQLNNEEKEILKEKCQQIIENNPIKENDNMNILINITLSLNILSKLKNEHPNKTIIEELNNAINNLPQYHFNFLLTTLYKCNVEILDWNKFKKQLLVATSEIKKNYPSLKTIDLNKLIIIILLKNNKINLNYQELECLSILLLILQSQQN